MSDQTSLIQIGKALSDELRVKILTELSTKPPMRHTDLLTSIGLDGAESNKLTYHLNILLDAGLIIKLDNHYKASERGREIYESLTDTIDEWEELAYRDELISLSGTEAVSLLCSDSLKISGYTYAAMGVLFYIGLRNPAYLLLVILGSIAFFLGSYYKAPKHSFEDKRKIIKHLEKLLGDNRLLPVLIFENINIGTGMFFLVIILVDHKIISLGFEAYVLLFFFIISLSMSVWLSKQMKMIWDAIRNGKKPDSYKDSLLIILNIIILFYLIAAILMFRNFFSDNRINAGMSWMSISFINGAWRLFKKSYQKP